MSHELHVGTSLTCCIALASLSSGSEEKQQQLCCQGASSTHRMSTACRARQLSCRPRLTDVLYLSFLLLCSATAFAPHSRITGSNAATTRRMQHFLLSTSSSSIQHTLPSKEELVQIGKTELAKYYDFSLDDWQLEAGGAICQGYNVIVCAPTGAGKTVVGEMALLHAFECGKNGIYTTPLKALSNQKYSDLCEMFGRSETGLSTGDLSINKGARITVMTTEVYRNIAWRSSTPQSTIMGTDELVNNQVVVLDEFHYMGQPGRGGVWEECVITSPLHTQIIGLSATLTNSQALASWMESVTSKPTVLIDVPNHMRPVPLRYLFANKEGLYPLFRDPDAGPGSPKGLLGLRGDGTNDQQSETRSKNGFSNKSSSSPSEGSKIPRGLEVNPALRNAADRRMRKVEQAIERQKLRQKFKTFDNDDDNNNNRYDSYPRNAVNSGPRRMSQREERREKERLLKNEMRRATPTLHAVVMRLKQKRLLPAIFFIFSRVGCDNAARNVCQFMKGPRDPNQMLHDELVDLGMASPDSYAPKKRKSRQRAGRRFDNNDNLLEDSNGRTFRSDGNFVNEDLLASMIDNADIMGEDDFDESTPLSSKNWNYYSVAGLLEKDQIQDVASRISRFNEDNADIAFDEDVCEQFLFGVGSHHAGMLPAHKSFVEILYQNNLMKVVFATETLAAGINMPARTTVICALAKRGDGSSMNLLETSNLLQMSGRAGRRGMDTDGTCVIVASPFEGEDDAASILTSPVKPITSQFSPSYSLAINLVARGMGKLGVAKQLVGKSFAMWERQQANDHITTTLQDHGDDVAEVMVQSAQNQFIQLIVDNFQTIIDKRSSQFDLARIQSLLDILTDREGLKKCSKSYTGSVRMLELEQTTLEYLERERKDFLQQKDQLDIPDTLDDLVAADDNDLLEQISVQVKRVQATEKEVKKHPLSVIAVIANELMQTDIPEASKMSNLLRNARDGTSTDPSAPVTAEELSMYAKSFITLSRRTRKLETANPGLDTDKLLENASVNIINNDDSWRDVLAITKTLVAYGCLTPDGHYNDNTEWENGTYSVTQAGVNVGMLGFDNSLWALVAVGGAWDVVGASSKLDDFRTDVESLLEDGNIELPVSDTTSDLSKAKYEAIGLVNILRTMTPAEVAGYIAGIVADSSKNSGVSVVDLFQRLTSVQQSVIQTSLLAMERLQEVQRLYAVDDNIRGCTLDIANCEVVTAWANGCTWNEALQLSGSSPGDLARTISRVLDAVRQLGNLPFTPVRVNQEGIHPDVRRLCRQAAQALNRYPVKDPLGLEVSVDEVVVYEANEDDEDDETGIEDDEVAE